MNLGLKRGIFVFVVLIVFFSLSVDGVIDVTQNAGQIDFTQDAQIGPTGVSEKKEVDIDVTTLSLDNIKQISQLTATQTQDFFKNLESSSGASGCNFEFFPVLRLHRENNAHVEHLLLNSYPYVVCVKPKNLTAISSTPYNCLSDQAGVLFSMNDMMNAHLFTDINPKIYTGYISTCFEDVSCNVVEGDCVGGNKCVVKLSKKTDAHAGLCDKSNYPFSVCCDFLDVKSIFDTETGKCVTNNDCNTGQKCENNECVSEILIGLAKIGDSCTSDADCEEGLECEQIADEGLVCSEPVEVTCATGADCGTNEACVNGVCENVEGDLCTSDTDCGNTECQFTGTQGECKKLCEEDVPNCCEESNDCVHSTEQLVCKQGTCGAPTDEDNGKIGQSCDFGCDPFVCDFGKNVCAECLVSGDCQSGYACVNNKCVDQKSGGLIYCGELIDAVKCDYGDTCVNGYFADFTFETTCCLPLSSEELDIEELMEQGVEDYATCGKTEYDPLTGTVKVISEGECINGFRTLYEGVGTAKKPIGTEPCVDYNNVITAPGKLSFIGVGALLLGMILLCIFYFRRRR